MNNTTIEVSVRLFGFLRKFRPGDSDAFTELTVPGSTVRDIIYTIGIPDSEPRIILLNGHHAPESAEVHDGDDLSLMTPVEGG